MKNKIFITLFVFLLILPIVSLFHPGLPVTHDGQDHVARIISFYQNLLDGNLIPRWAANLNWGFGHPILEFLYPLPSYIASFFHSLGFSILDSTKTVFVIGEILSFIFMYLWLSQFLSKNSSLLGAVLYSYAPYRFIDLYVRGDIGENLAFAFIPLILFFIYKISKKPNINFSIFGGISLALLILAHNAISLIFVPVILIYAGILIYLAKERKKLTYNYILLISIGFLLSAFFWIPALLEGKYTLRNIVTRNGYLNNFTNLQRLIYGKWSFGGSGKFSVQLGIVQWIGILLSPFLLYRLYLKKNVNFYLALLCVLITIFAIFIMLPISNFIWARIILLQNFQFPWRFLAITVFSTAVLGSFVLENLFKRHITIVMIISILAILFLSQSYWQAKDYFYKPLSFVNGIYKGTTDTGESTPIWSIRFMEHTPKAHLEVVDGYAQIKELERRSTYHKYTINVLSKTLFVENTLYFPGWHINANGRDLSIQFQNKDYRGQMLFVLDKGSYTIETWYSETKLRAISDAISVVVLFNIFGFLGFRFVKRYFS